MQCFLVREHYVASFSAVALLETLFPRRCFWGIPSNFQYQKSYHPTFYSRPFCAPSFHKWHITTTLLPAASISSDLFRRKLINEFNHTHYPNEQTEQTNHFLSLSLSHPSNKQSTDKRNSSVILSYWPFKMDFNLIYSLGEPHPPLYKSGK